MDSLLINRNGTTASNETKKRTTTCGGSFSDSEAIASVRHSAEQQIEREAQTRAMDPQSYRLSQMSQAALNGRYRRGKEAMSSEDVLRYFHENRSCHVQTADFEGNTGIDECECKLQAERCTDVTTQEKKLTLRELPQELKNRAVTEVKRLFADKARWMDFSRADAGKEKRRFPLSALAAVVAVAMCLMLIVASSVMLSGAASSIGSLKKEIDTTTAEISKLRSDFEVQNDLLEIRRIAMEEYGMVDEEFIKMEYMESLAEDSVESFEEKPRESVGLDAILSAIGLK